MAVTALGLSGPRPALLLREGLGEALFQRTGEQAGGSAQEDSGNAETPADIELGLQVQETRLPLMQVASHISQTKATGPQCRCTTWRGCNVDMLLERSAARGFPLPREE